MARDHRRVDAELVQEVLPDDPGFLSEVVERAVQRILKAEMAEHVVAASYERVERRTGPRHGHKPEALRTRVGTLKLDGAPRPRRDLLNKALLSLSELSLSEK
jgi:transposase-like protein